MSLPNTIRVPFLLLLSIVGCKQSDTLDAGVHRADHPSLGHVYYWNEGILCRLSLDTHDETPLQRIRRDALYRSLVLVLAENRFVVIHPEHPNRLLLVNSAMEQLNTLDLPIEDIQAASIGSTAKPCVAVLGADRRLYCITATADGMHVSSATQIPEEVNLKEIHGLFCSADLLGLSGTQRTWIYPLDKGNWEENRWSAVQLRGHRVFARTLGGDNRALWAGSTLGDLHEVTVPPRAYSFLSWEARADGLYVIYRRPRGAGVIPGKGYEWVFIKIGEKPVTVVPGLESVESIVAWLEPDTAEHVTTKPASETGGG